MKWQGKSDLSALKGKAVYLRFQIKKAGLYSFQIAHECYPDMRLLLARASRPPPRISRSAILCTPPM